MEEEQLSKVLIVEDDIINLKLMEAHLQGEGSYSLDVARNGDEALLKIALSPPDIILLDLMISGMNGFEVCQFLKNQEKTRLIPIIMITSLTDFENKVRGIEAGADDFLFKPVNSLDLLTRVQSLVRVKHLNDKLENLEKVLINLSAIAESKDDCTSGHLERMAEYSPRLGAALGLDTKEQQIIKYGALLHDIGKIAISDFILKKTGALTPEEYLQMKEHTLIGERICRPLRFSSQVGPIIRGHHEHWDGKGYPNGLKGKEIPRGARIVAVVDAYDAMISDRPYRKALPHEEACSRLLDASGEQFDPEMIEAFLKVFKK